MLYQLSYGPKNCCGWKLQNSKQARKASCLPFVCCCQTASPRLRRFNFEHIVEKGTEKLASHWLGHYAEPLVGLAQQAIDVAFTANEACQ